MEKIVWTLEEFEAEATRYARSLAPDSRRATLVTLSGELGAGKTSFVKAVARALGVEDEVSSPTFILEKIYSLPAGRPFRRLVHIDAYRLEKGSDLAPLGFDELMEDAGSLVMLEWPERVAGNLPEPDARISLTVQTDGSRMILYG